MVDRKGPLTAHVAGMCVCFVTVCVCVCACVCRSGGDHGGLCGRRAVAPSLHRTGAAEGDRQTIDKQWTRTGRSRHVSVCVII